MATLINPITADGDYDIECPSPRVLLRGSGTWGSGTISVASLNEEQGAYVTEEGGTWNANFTALYIGSPTDKLRFTLTGSSGASLYIEVKSSQYG